MLFRENRWMHCKNDLTSAMGTFFTKFSSLYLLTHRSQRFAIPHTLSTAFCKPHTFYPSQNPSLFYHTQINEWIDTLLPHARCNIFKDFSKLSINFVKLCRVIEINPVCSDKKRRPWHPFPLHSFGAFVSLFVSRTSLPQHRNKRLIRLASRQ